MVDILTRNQRSRLMARIKSKNTSPEQLIGKMLFSKGFRYRKNYKTLPGKPDLVFTKLKAVIFIHGCFWHGHDCYLYRIPKSNTPFWAEKILSNQLRDKRNVSDLLSNGWRVLIVWECAIRDKNKVILAEIIDKCIYWLNSDLNSQEIDYQNEIKTLFLHST